MPSLATTSSFHSRLANELHTLSSLYSYESFHIVHHRSLHLFARSTCSFFSLSFVCLLSLPPHRFTQVTYNHTHHIETPLFLDDSLQTRPLFDYSSTQVRIPTTYLQNLYNETTLESTPESTINMVTLADGSQQGDRGALEHACIKRGTNTDYFELTLLTVAQI